MATSGTYKYNVTGADIITEALGLVGAYSMGESIEASESADALRTLNMMLKGWQPKIGLWLKKELSLFFTNSQASYDIGPTGDHCAQNAVKTEIATAAAIAQNNVVVDSITGFGDTYDRDGIVTAIVTPAAGAITLNGALVASGIATLSGNRKIVIYSTGNESGRIFTVVGQNAAGTAVTENITGPNGTSVYSSNAFKTVTSVTIDLIGIGTIQVGQVGDPVGIEQDNDTLHWTYLVSTPLNTTLQLLNVLTAAVAVDNHVYSYTVKTPRPIEIVEARLHRADGYDVPLTVSGRLDYQLLSNKAQTGITNQVYYDKQLENGKFYLWLAPTNMQDYIKFTAKLPIQNIDNLTDDIEVAQEWFLPIAWQLAVLIYPKWHEGKFIDAGMALMAERLLDDAITSDSENAPTFIQISRSRR